MMDLPEGEKFEYICGRLYNIQSTDINADGQTRALAYAALCIASRGKNCD